MLSSDRKDRSSKRNRGLVQFLTMVIAGIIDYHPANGNSD